MGLSPEFKQLIGAVAAIGAMAIISLTSLAVTQAYKDTGKVDNTTADYFIAAFVTIAGFVGIIALAVIGKVIYKLVMPAKD